jgi:two-component system, NtrC family, nitrogen regulation sensor histidine kinase NtrY
MSKRLLYGLGAVLFALTVTLIVWQGSFSGNFGSVVPDDADQTFFLYGISILIILLFLTLGFFLVRQIVKLWVERGHDRLGSRIRTKLVLGALALSLMPVFYL